MKNFNEVNTFFKDKCYKNLIDFGLLPISWAFDLPNNADYTKKAILFFLSPLFIEALSATIALASALIIPTLIIHAIAAVFAGLKDVFEPNQSSRYAH